MGIESASKLLGHWERSRAHASHSHSLSFFVAFSAMWPIIVDTAEDDRQDGRGVCVGRDGKGWEGMGRGVGGCGLCIRTVLYLCAYSFVVVLEFSITLSKERCCGPNTTRRESPVQTVLYCQSYSS